MAEGEGGAGGFITQKVGPLPLVVWVMGGAGLVFLFVLMKGKSSSGGQANATNQISSLAPTEAEAFGTIEQQQQDTVNALTTLGQNQSALGGSLQTISGTIDTNQNWNAAQFANILGGLSQVESGQTAASDQATNYNNGLNAALTNWFNSLGAQVGGVSGQVAGVSSQVNGVNSNVLAGTQVSGAQYNELVGIMTNPWIKQFYENNVLKTLNPYQQQQYWIANQQVAQGNPA